MPKECPNGCDDNMTCVECQVVLYEVEDSLYWDIEREEDNA